MQQCCCLEELLLVSSFSAWRRRIWRSKSARNQSKATSQTCFSSPITTAKYSQYSYIILAYISRVSFHWSIMKTHLVVGLYLPWWIRSSSSSTLFNGLLDLQSILTKTTRIPTYFSLFDIAWSVAQNSSTCASCRQVTEPAIFELLECCFSTVPSLAKTSELKASPFEDFLRDQARSEWLRLIVWDFLLQYPWRLPQSTVAHPVSHLSTSFMYL